MSIADVGHGVFLGDFMDCDAHGAEFPLCVHLWSQLNVTEGRICRVCRGDDAPQAGKGLLIEWSEGQPLALMSVPLDEVVAYLRQPGNVLVHCAAGACRTPTIALLAKVARGDGPWGAIGHIDWRNWEVRGFIPDFRPQPTADVVRWWQSSRSSG